MRRLLPTLSAVLLLLVSLCAASAQAQESRLLTSARQLDLVTQHMATSAEREVRTGKIDQTQFHQVENLAALAHGFRFDLEANEYSGIQAQAAWAELAHSFLAARNAVGKSGSRSFQGEVLHVHSLMNHMDRRMGGVGFWYGPNGWTG